MNVITKSGSNNLKGSLFGYTRPRQLEAAWSRYESVNGSVQTAGTSTWDAGAEGGFPIAPDRLFVFGALDPGREVRSFHTDEWLAGIEREVLPNTSVGVCYTHRSIGRVLEDVANAPMVAHDLGVPGLSSVEYILANPSRNTPVLSTAGFLGAAFDDPVHKSDAVELTVNRRFSNNWSLIGSYRWSRLRGNFEGFHRDDNGQSDPGITSLYDFPTNDPSYTAIGVPQFGYRGDIRFLGDANGILPLDRPHQFKAFGNYRFPVGVSVGLALNVQSGAPLTPLAANPNYSNGGEIPEGPRGSGIQTLDGFKTRTPVQTNVDAQASSNCRSAATATSRSSPICSTSSTRER